jgi:hypothetical protein
MSASADDSFLDRPIARVLALGVIAAVVAILLAQHWDDLFPAEERAAVDPNDPVQVCIQRERAQIERMVADNPSMEPQKQMFLQRAEARCQAMEGGGNSGAPRLPTN